MNSYDITDSESGEFVFTATGHLFKPIPCVDAQGIPQADDSCAVNTTERNFSSCTTSGCHGDETAALSALLAAQNRIADLVTELDALLQLVDPAQFSDEDAVFTVAEGAEFNLGLGEITSSAVHNPFLTEALLDASIDAVMDEYGLPQQTSAKLGRSGRSSYRVPTDGSNTTVKKSGRPAECWAAAVCGEAASEKLDGDPRVAHSDSHG